MAGESKIKKMKGKLTSWLNRPGRKQQLKEEFFVGIALGLSGGLIILTILTFLMNKSTTLGISLAALAVAVATFFLRFVVDVVRSPVLSLELYPKPPDFHKVTVRVNEYWNAPFSGYYFALRVWNFGSVKAEHVRVKVVKIYKKNFTINSWENITQLNPDRLWWRLSDRGDYEPTIHPGTYEHCNIGYIFDPSVRNNIPPENIPGQDKIPDFSKRSPIFHVQVSSPSSNRPHLLPPGEYIFEIEASCSNGEKIDGAYRLTMTGWNEDEVEMLRSNIKIEEIDKKKVLGIS